MFDLLPDAGSFAISGILGAIFGGLAGYLGGVHGGRESARATLKASIDEAERERRSRLVDPVIEEGKARLLAFRQIVEASLDQRRRQRVLPMFEAMSRVHRHAPTEERFGVEALSLATLVMDYQLADHDASAALFQAIESHGISGLHEFLEVPLQSFQAALSKLEAAANAFVVGGPNP